MDASSVYVLLKNFSKSGLVKFHGVATSSEVARAWESAAASNWYFDFETDADSLATRFPITYDRMNNGEIA